MATKWGGNRVLSIVYVSHTSVLNILLVTEVMTQRQGDGGHQGEAELTCYEGPDG